MHLLFLDTETTGLPTRWGAPATDVAAWPRVVQAAWIVADEHGTVLKRVNRIIRPDGFTIPAEVARIHGITTERAKREGVAIGGVLIELAADLEAACLIVAHNIDFDLPILEAECHRAGLLVGFSKMARFCTMRQTVDVVRLPSARGGHKWPKLVELHAFLFQDDFDGAHDASADADACMRCYFALVRRGDIRLPGAAVPAEVRIEEVAPLILQSPAVPTPPGPVAPLPLPEDPQFARIFG